MEWIPRQNWIRRPATIEPRFGYTAMQSHLPGLNGRSLFHGEQPAHVRNHLKPVIRPVLPGQPLHPRLPSAPGVEYRIYRKSGLIVHHKRHFPVPVHWHQTATEKPAWLPWPMYPTLRLKPQSIRPDRIDICPTGH